MNTTPPCRIDFGKGVPILDGNYPVNFGGQAVGKVQVRRDGLYYCFFCRCRLSGDVVFRLAVTCGKRQENLGILVPDGDGFSLETRLAAKKLGGEELSFQLIPNRVVHPERFIPIYPEEPFAYLARLKDGYFSYRDGQPGVCIKEKAGT